MNKSCFRGASLGSPPGKKVPPAVSPREILAVCAVLVLTFGSVPQVLAQTDGVPDADPDERVHSAPAATTVGGVQVIPPKPVDVRVEYPDGATGTAVVSLSFVVTQQGQVIDPVVVVGDEPFASAAIAAATAWRFEPATRTGEPVAARIAMEVRFSQQVVKKETEPRKPEASAGALPAAPTSAPETPALQPAGNAVASVYEAAEVVVMGDHKPGSSSLSRAEARQIPGALFGDPLRAIDAMPGVSTIVSGLPLYYVRGAPPGNIGYYIDEIRVPMLYHAFLGPSVISPGLVDRVNVHASTAPANLGRLAGGVIEAELRVPDYERHYGGSMGLWQADGHFESPFAESRGNVFVGGRYTFTGLLLSTITPTTIDYWNYQVLADYDLTPDDQVRLFGFGAFDYLEDPDSQFIGTSFHRLDARYTHHFSADTRVAIGATVGVDETRSEVAGTAGNKTLGARVRLAHQISRGAELRIGGSVVSDDFDLKLRPDAADFLAIRDLFFARRDLAVGGFAELAWRPTPSIYVVPGVRVDLYQSAGQSAVGVDPRISARFQLKQGVFTTHEFGLSHQPPGSIPNIPAARVAGLQGGLQEALTSSSGVEAQLPGDIRGTFTVFQNVFFDLTDPYSLSQDQELDPDVIRKRMTGHAYGLEVELRRALTQRFGAMMSYTLSRSTRSFDTIETIAGSDRTHILNLAGMYTLGSNWRVGVRTLGYSGVPRKQRGEFRFPYGRARPFFRVDLRLERRFRLGPRSWWSMVAEVLNATASDEVIRHICGTSSITGDLVCDDPSVIPPLILPNVKIEAQF